MGRLETWVEKYIARQHYWVLLGVVFGAARLATWAFPYDSDHWIFYYVGKHWVMGEALYTQVWDHKAPLIFALNGVMYGLFGDNIVLHRIFLTLVSGVGFWLFYRLCLSLFTGSLVVVKSRLALLALVFFANLSQFTNSGNDTEAFGVVALLASLACYLRFYRTHRIRWLVLCGVAASCVVVLKINFSILLLPLLVDFVRRERGNVRVLLGRGLLVVMPVFAHVLAWIMYFADRGELRELYIATLGFNSKYLRAAWQGNLSAQAPFLAMLGLSLLFFVPSMFMMLRRRRKGSEFIQLLAVAAALFGVILGSFYGHYYLIILPYLCIVWAAQWRETIRSRLLVLVCIFSVMAAYGVSTKQLYNRFYGGAAADARNMSGAAAYVKSRTSPYQKVIFYGYGATFYQLAGRDSGSRYISASHPLLDEREGFGYGFNDRYIQDMEQSRPAYLVVDLATKKLYSENSRVMDYFAQHYSLQTSLPGYEIYQRLGY